MTRVYVKDCEGIDFTVTHETENELWTQIHGRFSETGIPLEYITTFTYENCLFSTFLRDHDGPLFPKPGMLRPDLASKFKNIDEQRIYVQQCVINNADVFFDGQPELLRLYLDIFARVAANGRWQEDVCISNDLFPSELYEFCYQRINMVDPTYLLSLDEIG